MEQVLRMFKRLSSNIKQEEDILHYLQQFFEVASIAHIKLKNPTQTLITLFNGSQNEIEEILQNRDASSILFLRGINFNYYVALPKDDRLLSGNSRFVLLWKNKWMILSLKDFVKWLSEITINC